MRTPVLALLVGFMLLPMLIVPLACRVGEGGDPPMKPGANAIGGGARLAQLNDPANPRPADTTYVNITGAVVTAIDTFDETQTGQVGNVYAQDLADDAPPYSGITIYAPSYAPPSLRVSPGDVVDIRTLYQEFEGPSGSPFPNGETLPELSGGTLSFRFEYLDPYPKQLDAEQLYSYDTGRQWIGVYAEVHDVVLYSDLTDDGKGRFTAQLDLGAGKDITKLPKIANGLCDMSALGLKKGQKLASVKGVVQYFFTFAIHPRSLDEIVVAE